MKNNLINNIKYLLILLENNNISNNYLYYINDKIIDIIENIK